jgi:hypothetical protein
MIVCELGNKRVHDRVENAVPSKKGENRRCENSVHWQHLVKVAHRKCPSKQEGAWNKVEAQDEVMSTVFCHGYKRDGHEKVYYS